MKVDEKLRGEGGGFTKVDVNSGYLIYALFYENRTSHLFYEMVHPTRHYEMLIILLRCLLHIADLFL